jgi:hypothetical protein
MPRSLEELFLPGGEGRDPTPPEGRTGFAEDLETTGAKTEILDECVCFWGLESWVGWVAFPD